MPNLIDLLAGLDGDDLAWQPSALCADAFYGDLFFPEPGPGLTRKIEHARTLCGQCDVRQECLSFALDNHIRDGIWGGLTRLERARLLRERGAA